MRQALNWITFQKPLIPPRVDYNFKVFKVFRYFELLPFSFYVFFYINWRTSLLWWKNNIRASFTFIFFLLVFTLLSMLYTFTPCLIILRVHVVLCNCSSVSPCGLAMSISAKVYILPLGAMPQSHNVLANSHLPWERVRCVCLPCISLVLVKV